jgi:hypothetical protein
MPAISPDAISNRIRLTNEVRAAVRPFVAERGTVDTRLDFAGSRVDAIVPESPPDEEGIAVFGAEDELFAGASEQFADPSVLIPMR